MKKRIINIIKWLLCLGLLIASTEAFSPETVRADAPHTEHDDNCYDGIKHVHTSACYRTETSHCGGTCQWVGQNITYKYQYPGNCPVCRYYSAIQVSYDMGNSRTTCPQCRKNGVRSQIYRTYDGRFADYGGILRCNKCGWQHAYEENQYNGGRDLAGTRCTEMIVKKI